jgi:hypothetical protein
LTIQKFSDTLLAQQSTIDNHQMPNHNNNQLTLASGQDILNVLNPYLTLTGDNDYTFDFQKIIPMDEELCKGEGWYDWCIQNWGTKWRGYDGRFNDDQTAFSFCTAWSPPLPVIKKLAEITGQTFILGYIEEGMFFCGKYTAGRDFDHDEFYNDIKAAPEELLNELGYEEWEEVESV